MKVSRIIRPVHIDVALLESRRVKSSWDSVLLGTDEMVLCMNEHNLLAQEPFLEARHLQDQPTVVFDQTFLQRHLLDAFCDAGSANYRIALQSNFVSLVIKATADGMGISTLLRSVQEREPGIRGVPFKPAQTMSFSLCWRADEYLSFANKRFVDFVQTTDIFERVPARGQRAE